MTGAPAPFALPEEEEVTGTERQPLRLTIQQKF